MVSERISSGLKNVFGTVSTLFLVIAFLLPGEAAARSAALDKVIQGAKKEGVLKLLWTEGHFGADVGIRDMVRATDPVGHEGCCQALKKLAFGAELTGIQVPTLILGGELDKGAPVDVLAETAAKIPGAKHVVIPGAGHITALESPEVFQRALDEFLVSL